MKASELYKKIEEKIALCEKQYEESRDDSFWSVIRHNEVETLEILYKRMRTEENMEKILPVWKEKLAELEKRKEEELEHPTFDWYDEHYHHKVLEGQCDAYRSMLELLEAESISCKNAL